MRGSATPTTCATPRRLEILDFTCISTPPRHEVEPERAGFGEDHYGIHRPDGSRADLVTTDVWTSMGSEAENDERMRDFADWQVDAEMMRVARPEAVFMHCLPAHRG